MSKPESDPGVHRCEAGGGSSSLQPAEASWTLFVTQGFGVGRLPFAPGTFGTVLGLLWFALLLLPGNFWLFAGGICLGVALSVWLCGKAEILLKQHDPPSVVLDEIVALPIGFLPWVASEWSRLDVMPGLAVFFASRSCWLTLVIFLLFRAFDIFKPWPVRQSQHLPGGWGVTVDDVLASVYVALLTLPLVR
jgi:phosphatidylglycerophosphatase A